MNDYTIGNYKIHKTIEGDFIEIYSTREQEGISTMIKNNIKYITLWERSFKPKSLESLLPFADFIEGIWTNGKYDLSLLQNFPNLKYLGTDLSEIELDFSFFTNLEFINLAWKRKYANTLHLLNNLKKLTLFSYNERDFTAVSTLSTLEELDLNYSKMESLEGIGKLKNLNKLYSYHSTKLISFGNINECQSLQNLWLVKTSPIHDYLRLEGLKKLRKLGLIDVGEIPDISFIGKLETLESLTLMGANVLNGDMSPCIGIKDLLFSNRPHYSHKLKEIQKLTELSIFSQ